MNALERSSRRPRWVPSIFSTYTCRPLLIAELPWPDRSLEKGGGGGGAGRQLFLVLTKTVFTALLKSPFGLTGSPRIFAVRGQKVENKRNCDCILKCVAIFTRFFYGSLVSRINIFLLENSGVVLFEMHLGNQLMPTINLFHLSRIIDLYSDFFPMVVLRIFEYLRNSWTVQKLESYRQASKTCKD